MKQYLFLYIIKLLSKYTEIAKTFTFIWPVEKFFQFNISNLNSNIVLKMKFIFWFQNKWIRTNWKLCHLMGRLEIKKYKYENTIWANPYKPYQESQSNFFTQYLKTNTLDNCLSHWSQSINVTRSTVKCNHHHIQLLYRWTTHTPQVGWIWPLDCTGHNVISLQCSGVCYDPVTSRPGLWQSITQLWDNMTWLCS